MSPQILGINASAGSIILTTCTALIGMAGVSAAMIGYLAAKTNMFERLLLLAGGLMLIDPRLMTDAAGIGILAFVLFMQFLRRKKADA